MFHISKEEPRDRSDVEALLNRAFGPGRYAKTAYRLREGVRALEDLNFVAWCDDVGADGTSSDVSSTSGHAAHMVGSLRFWPVLLGQTPAIMLGPLAMDPTVRGQGGGLKLMGHALDVARDKGHKLVILVGDAPYYAKVGFKPVPQGQIVMPGPVDASRLLVCELTPGAFDGVSGDVGKDFSYNPEPGKAYFETLAHS
ncbi:MAG: putative N-acetyltransferase YhbS [Parvibaculaceae bacterium]|jgi:predicted N-acetyltransferase YhbS|nr:N-acetyltransferase [Parvibaculaceae bacterium]